MKKIGMNFIDKAVAFINPTAAVQRLASKAKLTMFEYDAVVYNRERRGPSNLRGAEGFRSNYDRVELLKRSRDLAENVGLIRGLLMKFASHVAGSITYQARTSETQINSDIEAYWNAWWDNCDISNRHTGSTLMQVAVMSLLRDGDFLFVLVRDKDGNLKLQGVEADRLGDPRRAYTSLDLISGVHVDPETGSPTGYDVYLRTFGNAYNFQATVPAAQAFHLYDPLRIDQYRGISAFHTAINDCTDIYEIIASEKMSAKLASSQAGVVKRNNNNASDLSTLSTEINQDNQPIKLETIEPGRITYLEPGEEMVFPDGPNRPGGAFAEFHKILLRNICIGVGIPYSFAVDPSEMSGPTARLEMQQAGRTFRRYQKLLEDKVLKPIKNIVIADGIARGLIENHAGSKSTQGTFNFGANVSIDLGRESASAIAEFKTGLRTASDIYSERGQDFESCMRQRALEAKLVADLAKEYGIKPETISDINKPVAGFGQGGSAPQEQMQEKAPQQEVKKQENVDGDIEQYVPQDELELNLKKNIQENSLQHLSKLNEEDIQILITSMLNACELGKYSDIDFTPPQGARDAAKRALDVRSKKPTSQRGMTPVGIARARDLIAGKALSPDTIRRMHSFFSRHEVDKKGAGWDEQGKGWQAWNGWGGDAGFSWVKKVIKQMDSRDKKLEEIN
jgi:lambda family phage portal protein